jgi:nucleotide-binding universal stress UspA family protein
MTLIKAKTASVLACLEPVYGIVIAGLLFNEIPGVRVVAGSALILCAVASMQRDRENQKAEIEQAVYSLDWVQSVFDADGLSCKTHLLIRELAPGEDLVEFAKENEVAEIFVGAKQRSKVGKLLMGSTAQYVILNAPCPVVTTN